MKDWPKLIFTAAIAIVFVVSTFVSLIGAGQVLNAVLRAYVFEVEDEWCDRPTVAPEGEVAEPVQPQECGVNYNAAKRSIADGLGMFILAAPLAAASFWQTRRTAKD